MPGIGPSLNEEEIILAHGIPCLGLASKSTYHGGGRGGGGWVGRWCGETSHSEGETYHGVMVFTPNYNYCKINFSTVTK